MKRGGRLGVAFWTTEHRRIWLRANLRHSRAFTLVEVIVALTLLGVLMALLVPAFVGLLADLKYDQAISEIGQLQFFITNFQRDNEQLPDVLEQLDSPLRLDPWGNPYEYQTPDTPGWRGQFRKDRFLVPLNSDYDLFSAGPDGESRWPLRARSSWDDIVRANNGRFIGRAADF